MTDSPLTEARVNEMLPCPFCGGEAVFQTEFSKNKPGNFPCCDDPLCYGHRERPPMTSILVAAREAANLKRQFQAHAHRPENGIQGDCYRTAIACVLGVDRDSVPHSHDDMTGAEAYEFHGKWLREQGLRRLFIPINPAGSASAARLANEMWLRGDGLPMILTGHGRRGVNHCVVVHGENDFWCPILGAVADTGLDGGALPDGFYWAEWLVIAAAIREDKS